MLRYTENADGSVTVTTDDAQAELANVQDDLDAMLPRLRDVFMQWESTSADAFASPTGVTFSADTIGDDCETFIDILDEHANG